ncbi:GD21660 [Drosophila simulans]|uniref:GD21660 n=1 Tax=Drosophila simulans TaxID=7240 RepID=B4Q3X6_DROSI|nr:GD21660 [Drosophila simulans]
MELLSSEECLLIAQRTLSVVEEHNVILINSHVDAGSKDLMGYMGEYYKLHLEAEVKGDKKKYFLNYFIKSLPRKNEPQREECERKGVFQKESALYSQLLPKIQKYATKKLYPKCYYSRNDILVLEDLTQDYRHLRANEYYTLDHYKIVLEHLSELHAASIAWEEKENVQIYESYKHVLIELHLDANNSWYITGLKAIVFLAARNPHFQTMKAQLFIQEKLYNLLTKAEELVAPSKTIRNVLCHRDTWDRNILYHFNNKSSELPNACCIVDFQLTQYCSPTLDVLFLLYIVAPAEVRRVIYDECLEHYYKNLQHHLGRLGLDKNLITENNFRKECQRTRLAALKFDYYLNCDRSELLLRVIEIQPGYEETIMTPIRELVDYLMENENLYT